MRLASWLGSFTLAVVLVGGCGGSTGDDLFAGGAAGGDGHAAGGGGSDRGGSEGGQEAGTAGGAGAAVDEGGAGSTVEDAGADTSSGSGGTAGEGAGGSSEADGSTEGDGSGGGGGVDGSSGAGGVGGSDGSDGKDGGGPTDAGSGPVDGATEGGIACGTASCAAPQICCRTLFNSSCADPGPRACVGGTTIACDGPDDCDSGEVCCGQVRQLQTVRYYSEVKCQKKCDGTEQFIACDPSAPRCPPSMVCKPSTLMSGYSFCGAK